MSTSTVAARPTRARRPDWRDDAACRDADPEPFFPGEDIRSARAQVKAAKLICRSCSVRTTCLPADFHYLAVNGDHPSSLVDLGDGERGQFAPAQAAVGSDIGHELVALAVQRGAEGLA